MEASREFSHTPRRLPPCSGVSVLQKTRMSHFWDTHHNSHSLSRIVSSFDQWAVDRDSVLTLTISAKIGKTATWLEIKSILGSSRSWLLW